MSRIEKDSGGVENRNIQGSCECNSFAGSVIFTSRLTFYTNNVIDKKTI